jgi:hypothetical protein
MNDGGICSQPDIHRWTSKVTFTKLFIILLDSIYIKYYSEILFAWCTDTSSDIEIK